MIIIIIIELLINVWHDLSCRSRMETSLTRQTIEILNTWAIQRYKHVFKSSTRLAQQHVPVTGAVVLNVFLNAFRSKRVSDALKS